MLQVTDIDWTVWYFYTLSCFSKSNLFCFIIILIDLYYCILLFELILFELLISLVLYVAALEMVDLQQLKEAYSQTIDLNLNL